MARALTSLRRNLIALGVLAAVVAVVGFALTLRRQERLRRSEACRQQRNEIASFRANRFDAPLAQMRQMRLNPEQAATLRRVDPAAYARYAQAYGDQVEKVAQAADRLGAMVDAYRGGNCLEMDRP